MALLRSLDWAEGADYPPGYDHAATRAHFEELVRKLDDAFACKCTADRGIQDSTRHADAEIPPQATRCGVQLTVSVSNFGGLAVVSAEWPGVYLDLDEAQALGAVHPADRSKVESVLLDLGYTIIPESLLNEPYDEVNPVFLNRSSEYPATWWLRYFDYV